MSKATNIYWHSGNLTQEERWGSLNCVGCTLWFTGLSGSGKSTIASALEQVLVQKYKVHSFRMDGDNIRFGLNKNLGFSPEDRAENIRRIGEVAKLFADSGSIAITSFISPYAEGRDAVRQRHEESKLKFVEVFVSTPLDECEKRDPKGLYVKARTGEIPSFTGISAPYEEPKNAELVLKTKEHSIDECVEIVIEYLTKNGLLKVEG
mmetsp:Transcript_2728/g.7518  ORF Transcript_2728/g.7518 Transcript_2728/m.7518 type:complete len:207 (+) Transcript_2728:89-709(+)|eukprot:CAMPEP_0119132742 /NCGR_PEP_ID=MMETSP1310-20130426/12222_1 /TAXON_ID=464262 /ORGANISM="Genus nov. species nov., Strain RCC2339" /LENGTH=206 /DNA_ID=CAMNT_0007123395 /DNA_START=61 /DNA_END=681 /DNA_ORIENTATION=+